MNRDERTFIIQNVRVSFPHLFEKPIINGDEGKCGARLMLDPTDKKHKAMIDKIFDCANTLVKEEFKGVKKIADEKYCLREDPSRAEYEDLLILSANSPDYPVVMKPNSRERASDVAQSGIYAGCYVTAKIELWPQDNTHGKRINARLVSIRFEGDGEPLDGTRISESEAVDGFDVSDEEDFEFDIEEEAA